VARCLSDQLLAASSRHAANALLSVLIVATFLACAAVRDWRDRATQDRAGMIPRDWHRELKMITLAATVRRGGACATGARNCKLA
jgi:hypothetical protein